MMGPNFVGSQQRRGLPRAFIDIVLDRYGLSRIFELIQKLPVVGFRCTRVMWLLRISKLEYGSLIQITPATRI